MFVIRLLSGPGGDLLSRVMRRSTIGAEGFHGRVRNGIGCFSPRCDHQAEAGTGCVGVFVDELLACVRRVFALAVAYSERYWSRALAAVRAGGRSVKPIERLVPVSFTHCCASTPGLSTWWSSTALGRDLVSRGASRLDAFSGYPVRA